MPGWNPVGARRAPASARGSRLPLVLGDTEPPAPPASDKRGSSFRHRFGSLRLQQHETNSQSGCCAGG